MPKSTATRLRRQPNSTRPQKAAKTSSNPRCVWVEDARAVIELAAYAKKRLPWLFSSLGVGLSVFLATLNFPHRRTESDVSPTRIEQHLPAPAPDLDSAARRVRLVPL